MTNIDIIWARNDLATTERDVRCENPFPSKRETMKNPNLILTPVETSSQTFCRHCGERIKMSNAGDHLLTCQPEVYFAIDAEFDAKEARALELAAN